VDYCGPFFQLTFAVYCYTASFLSAENFWLYPYGRFLENEADEVGLILASKVCSVGQCLLVSSIITIFITQIIFVGLFQCTISKRIVVENGNDVRVTPRAQYRMVVDLVTEVGRTGW
jgi:hypothetical protein